MTKTTDMLIFQVMNSESIESGCTSHFVFDKNGGTLGAGENNHWIIQDRKKSLPFDLARIEWRDKHYCFQVMGKMTVFINNTEVTSRSGFIRLAQGDDIKLGEINIKVYIEDESKINIPSFSLKPEEIIDTHQDHLKDLIGEKQKYDSSHLTNIGTIDDKISQDPLVALSSTNDIFDEKSSLIDSSNNSLLSSFKSSSTMSTNHFIDLPEAIKNTKSEYIENAYVTISPLLREMDVKLPLQNSQDINDILTEVGKTIKTTVEGLLILQQTQHSLSDKHLRPIEDNPLRLNLDYPTTMEILFGNQKSPVHLAAPSAISESLSNLLLHNEANRIAIVSALTTILQAFSPKVLLERFENYRRSNENQEANGAWAWEMYENYYRELTSTRQQGFEKLFWEVYAQAYDKALRENSAKK